MSECSLFHIVTMSTLPGLSSCNTLILIITYKLLFLIFLGFCVYYTPLSYCNYN